jgi:AAA domain
VTEQTDWETSDVDAVRAVAPPGTTNEDITRLLDWYRSRGKKIPVAYATNGKTSGRLAKDLNHIKTGQHGSDGAADAAATAVPEAFSRRLVLTRASEIKPKSVLWGWEDRIPTAHVSLIPGREGIGKSLFLTWMTAQITRGTLPGCYFGLPRGVFYSATEDSWQHTIVPRLMAAGADLERVYRINVETVEVSTGTSTVMELTMPRDCDLVSAEVKRLEVAMIALDPLMSVIDQRVDTHNDRDLRTVLEPIGRLASETDCMIVGLAHFNKSGNDDPLNLVTGSRAFTAFVRAVIAIAHDPDSEDGQCIISQVKNNLGRLDQPNLTYIVQPVTVETEDDEEGCKTARLVFTGQSEKSVRDILADVSTAADRSERAECAAWLRDVLDDGARRTKEIEGEATAAGFSNRTLTRARKQLGVKAGQQATGDQGRNEWWLWLPGKAESQ